MSTDAREQIREFITGRFSDISLEDGQDIFALGFVNSLFAMELVMFVEQRFAIRVPNNELRRENFRSIQAMVDLIGRVESPVESSAG